MKRTILALLMVCMHLLLHAQTDTTVLIIPCVAGNLVIDGVDRGTVDADDAHREKLSFGDHYVQLKTASKKYNTTLKVDRNLASGIIKIGCEEGAAVATAPSAIASDAGLVRVLDKQLYLNSPLSNQTEKNVLALDGGDEIIVNCKVLNEKGSANISIVRMGQPVTEIYRKQGFYSIDKESVHIPAKGVYMVTLTTDALFGKKAAITLDRKPSPNSKPTFNTTPRIINDTTSEEVLNTVTHVFSTGSGHPPRSAIKVNLPPGTKYWVYWIGVGQKSRQQFNEFVTQLSQVGKALSPNPLVQFGFGLISSLPVMNIPSTVTYRFANTLGVQQFMNGQQYTCYNFKYADNVSSDYALISDASQDITLCLNNQSGFVGEDVEIRAVAFIVRRKVVIEE